MNLNGHKPQKGKTPAKAKGQASELQPGPDPHIHQQTQTVASQSPSSFTFATETTVCTHQRHPGESNQITHRKGSAVDSLEREAKEADAASPRTEQARVTAASTPSAAPYNTLVTQPQHETLSLDLLFPPYSALLLPSTIQRRGSQGTQKILEKPLHCIPTLKVPGAPADMCLGDRSFWQQSCRQATHRNAHSHLKLQQPASDPP